MDFNIDYEAGLIRCFYCGKGLPVEMFFPGSNAGRFAQKIPEERRDEFMEKLGYEKKIKDKKSILLFYIVVLITFASALRELLEKSHDATEFIPLILTGLFLVITTFKTYLTMKNPKYVRKD